MPYRATPHRDEEQFYERDDDAPGPYTRELTFRESTAAKQHVCDACGGAIPPGARYSKRVYFDAQSKLKIEKFHLGICPEPMTEERRQAEREALWYEHQRWVREELQDPACPEEAAAYFSHPEPPGRALDPDDDLPF